MHGREQGAWRGHLNVPLVTVPSETNTMKNSTLKSTVDGADARDRARRETLARFSTAWSTGDVDGLMALMSDDPTYSGSTGPGPGTLFRGQEQVRAAFQRMVGGNAGSAAPAEPPPRMFLFGDHALVYWTLMLPGADGIAREVAGVDVMSFTDDGRIAMKDAYRKAFS